MMLIKIVCVFLTVECISASKLPAYIPTCYKYDPNVSQCTMDHANQVIPVLAKGDKSINWPSLLPLKISKLVISANDRLKLIFTNVRMSGLEAAKMIAVSLDLKSRTNLFKIFFPLVNIIADYEVDGRFMLLPVRGSGVANITFVNVTVGFKVGINTYMKNNVEYMKFDYIDTNYDVKHASYWLDNLFNGDKILGEQTNKVLNDNWDTLLKDLGPMISNALAKIIRTISDNFLGAVPFSEIYPTTK